MNQIKSLKDLNIKTDYRTGRDDPIFDFYTPCLNVAEKYCRAVGYFRSSIFLLTGEAIINFVKVGGKIQLICSPELTQEDINAIQEGKSSSEILSLQRFSEEIEKIVFRASENYSVSVLATLIKVGALDIKIAIRENGKGIYHEKLGIFTDKFGQSISFIGSANETLNAWHKNGNFESIEVFCSWHKGAEQERVERHKKDFDDLWFGISTGIKTINMPEAITKQLLTVAHEDLHGIDISRINYGKKKEFSINKGETKITNLSFHQSNAIEVWKKEGYRGIFEHATGSGKTITALAALYEHISKGDPAIILVPSALLLTQWIKEITEEIPDCVRLSAGSGNILWKKNNKLRNFLSDNLPQLKRVVIATMQTASSEDFISQIPFISNLMIVVDEVHQVGSENNSKALTINANKRLGLSATPIRYGDSEGTQKIFDYFGPVLPPVISLYDAIQAGRLVDYEYFPHIVNMTAIEAEDWKKISKDIRREIAISNSGEGSLKLTNKAKMLLIARSRIAKKSSVKIGLAAKVIKENYREGQSWLVYCEDKEQLQLVAESITAIGVTPLIYFSEMDGDSVETLKLFRIHGGVLVSIRCLDEGVDIPSISHALILASSQNPRQFIQRRGRVLRKHPSKVFAGIHDAIVVPVSLDNEPEQFSLLKSELVRAYEFAKNAMNKSAQEEIIIIGTKLGIDLTEIITDGIEEDLDE